MLETERISRCGSKNCSHLCMTIQHEVIGHHTYLSAKYSFGRKCRIYATLSKPNYKRCILHILYRRLFFILRCSACWEMFCMLRDMTTDAHIDSRFLDSITSFIYNPEHFLQKYQEITDK